MRFVVVALVIACIVASIAIDRLSDAVMALSMENENLKRDLCLGRVGVMRGRGGSYPAIRIACGIMWRGISMLMMSVRMMISLMI
jgi:hypothetical protein